MTIRNYHDFHLAVNSGALEYLIIQKADAGLYSATGNINGVSVSCTDDYRTLKKTLWIRCGHRLPKLADLEFNHRLTNIFGYALRSSVMYRDGDGTFRFVPGWNAD